MPAITPILDFIHPDMSGAEIGVQGADSSVEILKKGCSLLCIDPWEKTEGYLENCDQPLFYNKAMAALKPYVDSGKATVFRGSSFQASLPVRPYSLDFVFIDGNHSYEFVLADCIIWWEKLRPGGFLSGHDYTIVNPPTHEVKRAVDTWATLREIAIEQIGECWMAKK